MLKNPDSSKELVPYKKSLPLGEGLSFSRDIKVLRDGVFTPYVLLVEEVPSMDAYLVETVFDASMFMARPGHGFADLFFRPKLLNRCMIKCSKLGELALRPVKMTKGQ